MRGLKERLLYPDRRMPLVVEPAADACLCSHVPENKPVLLDRLRDHGALLLRGFAVRSVEDFSSFIDLIAQRRMAYVHRSTPRTLVGDRIFTATEYPAHQEIPLHNENSYQRDWPVRLGFCCLVPAADGGETPLADMHEITAAIGEALLDKFRTRGVSYVRHYYPHVDIPWQTAFQTDDREEVARYCISHDIALTWLDDGILRTTQVAQGVARHPETAREVLFNQAHLFHVSSLGSETVAYMKQVFGSRLPRHACYGDGAEIASEELQTIRAAFQRHEVRFPWQAGDILLIDNMQAAHGRRPYTGCRRMLAALLDPYSEQAQVAASAEGPRVGSGPSALGS